MQSLDLIRLNLKNSRDRVLTRIEDMRDRALVTPTSAGGCHTLWVLGHLAYIECLVVHTFLRGEPNPLAHWEAAFDGADVSTDPAIFPPFEQALAECREARERTIAFADSLTEADLDRPGAGVPHNFEDFFGTHRLGLQYLADHWYMHRGHLADCRRAAGVGRIWV